MSDKKKFHSDYDELRSKSFRRSLFTRKVEQKGTIFSLCQGCNKNRYFNESIYDESNPLCWQCKNSKDEAQANLLFDE